MSFRNISNRQDYKVLRTRPKKSSDEKEWHAIYPPQVGKTFKAIQTFAVANWVPIVVGIVALLGGVAGGFYVGQAYSAAEVGKKLSVNAIDLLPKKIKSQLQRYL